MTPPMTEAERKSLEWVIASSLDHPSVYMGGPSENSRRRAERIIRSMESRGYRIAPPQETPTHER